MHTEACISACPSQSKSNDNYRANFFPNAFHSHCFPQSVHMPSLFRTSSLPLPVHVAPLIDVVVGDSELNDEGGSRI